MFGDKMAQVNITSFNRHLCKRLHRNYTNVGYNNAEKIVVEIEPMCCDIKLSKFRSRKSEK